MGEWVLAIDLGFSWCKAAFIDPAGKIVATGRAYTRAIHPARNGMLEALWEALGASVRAAKAQLPAAATVAAIGISCRGEFGFCLDAQGQGFWPIWDTPLIRSSPYYAQAFAPELWHGQDPFAYGYAMHQAALLLYLKHERPHEWQQIRHEGALHDYLVYRLTGAWVTDPTSGPGYREWPDEIVHMTGLPPSAFARVLPPQEIAGGLGVEAAALLALPTGTPVIVGFHDGAASSLGARAVEPGDTCLTLGTNFVLRAVTGERLVAQSFSYCILPGRWTWVNNVSKASAQLDIVAEALAERTGDLPALHRHLGALAAEVAPGCNGLVLERIVAGQEPLLRERVQAAQAAGHSPGSIYRAIMEALAGGVIDLANRSRRDGATLQHFIAAGGGVHHRHLLQLLAARLDAPIEVAEAEAGLLGVAIAAAVGSGWYATLNQAMLAMTRPGPIVEPDPVAAQYYRRQIA